MMAKTIVAMCGKKGCGKDTAAEALLSHGFAVEKFAGPLKDACKVLFGFDDSQVEGDAKDVLDARYSTTPRKILQFVGTELFQYKINEVLPGIGRSFWAQSLVRRIEAGTGNVVVTDMRFQHELDALKALAVRQAQYKVISIKICRPTEAETDTHASETELDTIECDHILHNDADKSALWRQVAQLAQLTQLSHGAF